jgi:hypothetical protein
MQKHTFKTTYTDADGVQYPVELNCMHFSDEVNVTYKWLDQIPPPDPYLNESITELVLLENKALPINGAAWAFCCTSI